MYTFFQKTRIGSPCKSFWIKARWEVIQGYSPGCYFNYRFEFLFEGDWEVLTETDSDDDAVSLQDDIFAEAYEEALRAEYKESKPVFQNASAKPNLGVFSVLKNTSNVKLGPTYSPTYCMQHTRDYCRL